MSNKIVDRQIKGRLFHILVATSRRVKMMLDICQMDPITIVVIIGYYPSLRSQIKRLPLLVIRNHETL